MRQRTIEIVPETKPQFVTVNEEEIKKVVKALCTRGFKICLASDTNTELCHQASENCILDKILEEE